MKITYDPEADALYIELRNVSAVDSVDIEDGVLADLDAEGHVIGFEVLDASRRLTPEQLTKISVENLVLGKKAALSMPGAARLRRRTVYACITELTSVSLKLWKC